MSLYDVSNTFSSCLFVSFRACVWGNCESHLWHFIPFLVTLTVPTYLCPSTVCLHSVNVGKTIFWFEICYYMSTHATDVIWRQLYFHRWVNVWTNWNKLPQGGMLHDSLTIRPCFSTRHQVPNQELFGFLHLFPADSMVPSGKFSSEILQGWTHFIGCLIT